MGHGDPGTGHGDWVTETRSRGHGTGHGDGSRGLGSGTEQVKGREAGHAGTDGQMIYRGLWVLRTNPSVHLCCFFFTRSRTDYSLGPQPLVLV